ncbi:MAG TPA: DNA translocase FtsK [Rectinemataceae bacterium]|nr:DNA translocase FtsK [Rectinemataceae bacterium]
MAKSQELAQNDTHAHNETRNPKAAIVIASKPGKPSAKKAGNGKKGAASEGNPSIFRTVSGVVGLTFFALAGYLFLTITLSLYWPSGWAFLVAPGHSLLGAFSWAAFYLPLWCLFAALLALLPTFHPRLTYLLASSALPFLVAAGFARISTEIGAFFENHPVFAAVGISSLYAGLGFLFAASLAAVIFGFVKLSAWMRAAGIIVDAKASRPKPKERPSKIADLKGRFRQWMKDRKEKRSQAEIRLRTAQSITSEPFDLDLPELPALAGLKAGRKVDMEEGKPKAIPVQEASASAANVAQVSAASASAQALTPALAPASKQVPAPAQAPTSTLDASGKVIEFTSVPPQAVSGGGVSADDEEKKALVQRILERKKKTYAVPVDGILNTYPDGQYWVIDDKTKRNAEVLRETLAEFNIEAEVTGIRKGPVITMYEILPAHGVKISKITNLSDNIALRLAASSVRIVAPIPGKHAVGIEVPNDRRAIVSLREIIENEAFRTSKMEIPYALGKNISGEVQFSDLTQMPHLLIAGATGSGKSVCVNAIILSILYRRTPEEVKLILIDPKIVELKLYNGIPHLLTPVVTDPKRAFQALQYCICEMERRYLILDKAGVRDIKSYNKRVRERNLAQEKLPYIVVIVDEFADLMATTGKELEATLARLAAMSRAVGIHLVLATQRPSIDVITGLIKANIPSRIAFMVASKFDSRIIIDMVGAEKLLGRGDMLYSGAQDPFPVRMQGAFVSEEEVERAVAHVKTLGEPEYIDDEIFYDEEEENAEPGLFDDGEGDPLFEKALEIVLQQGKASASFIQRRLKIGYNRSARLVELMEERGIVGPSQGSKPRDVLRNPELFGGHPDAGKAPVERSLEEKGDDE